MCKQIKIYELKFFTCQCALLCYSKQYEITNLSNYEVMVHLQQIKEQRTSGKGQLATITYEVIV